MKKLRRVVKWILAFLTASAIISILLSYSSMWISPANYPLIAFFGLAYPIILISYFALMTWHALRKSKWFVVMLVILVAGTGVHAGFFRLNLFTDNIESEKSISVMSYNVELFGWYHWKTNISRRNKVFEQLRQNTVDVYCFQEFFYTPVPGRFDTRDSLTGLLNAPYYHEHYTHEVDNVQFYGIATLSKHPIVNRGVIEFPNDKNNICIYSDILVGTDIFRVYNGHLCSIRFSGDEREYAGGLVRGDADIERSKLSRMYLRLKNSFVKRAWQAELVREHMLTCPYPIIFCGDFNDTPVSYAYGVFHRLLNDTFRSKGHGTASTYIGNFPSFRIDHIFTSNEFKTLEYGVLPDELSDHRAVRVELVY